MITSIENNMGIISFDNALLDQIVADALSGHRGDFKLLGKSCTMESEGVELVINIALRFGTSINLFSNSVLNYIANKIEDNLELPIKSIKLRIVAMYSKKSVGRDIEIEYNPKLGIQYNRD